jgi:putative ABC transport system substrate-binding protein
MKLNSIKRGIALAVCIPMILTGCSSNIAKTETTGKTETKTETAQKAEEKTYKIGISQLMEHPSLDQARQGFIDEMKSLGLKVEIDYLNAQGEIANAQMIAEKFVKNKVDLIYTISTPSTQSAKKATENTRIPVVFSSVTDPVFSQIVSSEKGIENVTGISNRVNAADILVSAKDLKNDASVIGIIYNTGESNSEVQVNKTKAAAAELGLTIETVGITSVNVIPQAISTISKKAEGLYIVTDNMVASAIELVAKLAEENKLITISADGTHVDEGIMLSNGISFYGIGKQSAKIAKQILVDKVPVSKIPVQKAPEFEKRVNLKVAASLGFAKDNKAFAGAEFVGE